MLTQYLDSNNRISFSGPATSLNKLEAGIYDAVTGNFGDIFLNKKDIKTDGLIELPNSISAQINEKVDDFLSERVKDAFKRYDMLYKRGILLYGPPGTGKTSIINVLARTAIKKDMIVLMSPDPYLISPVVKNIRTIEKSSRPIMVIWEEFERWLDGYEEEILDLLDGVNQVEDIFYVATTNFIENIPLRIRNRPSRFAEVIEVGPLEEELRRHFIKAKVHEDDNIDVEQWVRLTEGLTIDHIKDLIISVLVLGLPLETAILKLRELGSETNFEFSSQSVTIDDKEYPVRAIEKNY